MNIKLKKLMSVLLCCAMLFGMLPVEAFAAEAGVDSGITVEKNVVEVTTESVPSDVVLPDSPSEDTPAGEPAAAVQPDAAPAPDEDPARVLYNKLKSFSDYEALRTYINSMSAEQLEMLQKFFTAQDIDPEEWMDAFLKQEPTAEESVPAEIAEEQPAVEAPVVGEPVVEEPEAEEPEDEESVVEEPVAEESVVEEPVTEEPEAEEPVDEAPVVDEPETEEPEDETVVLDFEFSAPTVAADNPQMKYYNGKNYVAYDVAKSRDEGYNDSNGTYVTSVTLGDVAVDQANSNQSYGSNNANNKGSRVGKTLSSFYPGLITNGNGASKTLVITPAAGYYVTQVTVACCDGGRPYQCGTWDQGKAFSNTFNITTGGALSMQMPSDAFGHGSSNSLESRDGEEQYFILIRVAPVPEPLFVAYDYGIMNEVLGDAFGASPFANSEQWTTASAGNHYGTGGSNETRYTQFRYAYANNSEVSNWKHVTNTVTEAAKRAAAEKGYYFTGWEVTYYVECSNYSFSQKYSDPAMIGENVDLRLITHAKLVAQWAPVKMTVQKVVEGLNTTQNYTINVLKNNGAFDTVTFNGTGSKEYSPVVPGIYSVTEEGANQRVEIDGKYYDLTTTYSDPVEVTAAAIAAGNQKTVSLVVTNTYSEVTTIDIPVSKVWSDNNNQDGIRPESITVVLNANGNETGKTLVLNDGNSWTGTFAELDKYAGGKEITYTIEELTVAGYSSAITGDQAAGYTVTNTHTPAVVEVSGSKTWNDNNNQDGARPTSIAINLLANGKVIKTVTVTEADGWSWSFENLPKYEDHGAEIIYSITENAVEDYTTTYNGYNVINTHTPEQTSVTVTKAWKDNNDQDGIRPNDVTIKLLADGKETGKTLVLNDANGWTGSFTGLDKFAEGKEIVYTVEELTVEGYTSVITGSQAAGYTVINTHETETLEVSGKKTWDDANDQDGKRPESITIRLLANGVEVDHAVVTESDGWDWSFEGLPKYENHGKEITYTITEDSVEGYTASYNGFNVTNKYSPEETSITVTKSWQDNNDQDGIRPEKITVNLLANGAKAASAQLTAEGNWTYTFLQLDAYDKGEKIVYTVEEEAVEGYETVITGDAAKGFTVTNSHTPETVEVSGKKTWDDDNNRDGKRPGSITVRLLANGKETAVATVTADDAWTFRFSNLPKFKAGEEVVYTVTEDAVEGYSVQYSDKNFDITNKYTPGKTSITVTKRWIDGSNHDGIRPSSVTIYLYADDVKVDSLKLTAEGNWTGVFDDLHVYENGKRIAYTISEKSVRGYNATFTGSAEHGFTVTNTHNIIPKTGDDSNLPLYVSLFGASISALAVLMFLAKPRKKGKDAR